MLLAKPTKEGVAARIATLAVSFEIAPWLFLVVRNLHAYPSSVLQVVDLVCTVGYLLATGYALPVPCQRR